VYHRRLKGGDLKGNNRISDEDSDEYEYDEEETMNAYEYEYEIDEDYNIDCDDVKTADKDNWRDHIDRKEMKE
jgi:hypothetical protein